MKISRCGATGLGRAALPALLAVLLFVTPASAQQMGAIVGTVTSESSNDRMPGVQVTIAELNRSTVTNNGGRYVLNDVPAGSYTLQISRLAYRPQSRTITVAAGATITADFALAPEAIQLEGMVVTALGIPREQRALGYAVQDVKGDQITAAVETNLVNALAGQVAGIQVTNVGPAGGSSRIVLRGTSSIAGENQPLFVIDGMPIDNTASTYIRAGRRAGGVDPTDPTPPQTDYGNAIRDINPEDIESITVLKGANAAALYGSRAANGVIVITTKRAGSGGPGVQMSVSQNTTFSTPLIMPTYQNVYGQGAAGRFSFVNGRGGGQNDGSDESWGPPMDGRLIPSWYSNGQPVPFLPHPYNVRQFFQTARAVDNHIAVSAATESAEARLSINRLDETGMVPTHQNDRTAITLNGGVQAREGVRFSGSGTYTNVKGLSVPGRGYTGFNPLQGYVFFGRQVDTWKLREYKDENGAQKNWNYNYHDNPYWEVNERENTQDRDRLTGHLQMELQLQPWLGLTARSGTDWYTEARKENIPKSPPTDLRFRQGGFDHSTIFRQERNSEAILAFTPDELMDGRASVALRLGGNMRDNTERLSNTSVSSLVGLNTFAVTNAANPPVLRTYEGRKKVNSLYGHLALGWQDFLYVDVTARNDWSSTLPSENNSYFYPSVSTSVVVTELPGMDALRSLVSFGKVRASWARVGNDASPFQLQAVMEQRVPFGTLPVFSVNTQIANAGLRPEKTDSWEFGTELRSGDGRLGLDLTYYNSATTDQILPVQLSAASGFTSQILNAGKVTNKGIELALDVTPVELANGFRWTVLTNFARNRSFVEELYEDLQSIVLGEFWYVNVEARRGERYGVLNGPGYLRDDQNRIMVDDLGWPIVDPDRKNLGHYEPDFLAGIRNTFTLGALEGSFLVDWRQGGSLYSVSNVFGRYAGVLVETLDGRESDQTLIPGIRASDGRPNTTPISTERWQHQQFRTPENNIYDGSYIKLKEARFGFDLPPNVVAKMPVRSARFSVVGRNLVILKKHVPHIDPETGFDASNFQGIEYGQLPSARTFGFTVRLVP